MATLIFLLNSRAWISFWNGASDVARISSQGGYEKIPALSRGGSSEKEEGRQAQAIMVSVRLGSD